MSDYEVEITLIEPTSVDLSDLSSEDIERLHRDYDGIVVQTGNSVILTEVRGGIGGALTHVASILHGLECYLNIDSRGLEIRAYPQEERSEEE